MKAEHLLEAWGTDLGELSARARRQTGDAPLLLGGAIADDVGTLESVADVYWFCEGSRPSSPTTLALFTTVLGHELAICIHAVPLDDIEGAVPSLRSFLVDGAAPPHPGREALDVLHALYQGIDLHRSGDLDDVRAVLGVDVFPAFVAAGAAERLASELRDGSSADPAAVLDLALALEGWPVVDDDCRLALARRVLDRGSTLVTPELVDAASGLRGSAVVASARALVAAVDHPLLRAFGASAELDVLLARVERV